VHCRQFVSREAATEKRIARGQLTVGAGCGRDGIRKCLSRAGGKYESAVVWRSVAVEGARTVTPALVDSVLSTDAG